MFSRTPVCFAQAGVIIATAFVHVLSDASGDLSDPCLGLSGGAQLRWLRL